MQKVYLLLRNNKQEGPYNLQQLLQLPVKNTDLIWVEGSSAAWSYPFEIKELKPYLTDTLKAVNTPTMLNNDEQQSTGTIRQDANKGKHIFVSLPQQSPQNSNKKELTPEETLELKAEALREKVQAYQNTHSQKDFQGLEMKLQRTMDDVAGDYADWAVRSKKKQKLSLPAKPLMVSVLIILVAFTAWTLFSQKAKSDIRLENDTPLVDAQVKKETNEPNMVSAPAEMEVQLQPPLNEDLTNQIAKKHTQQPAVKKEPIATAIIIEDSPVVNEPVAESPLPATQKGEVNQPVTIEEKEKKSFGKVIEGFFGKFKSKKGEAEKQPSTASGGRKATKREETSGAAPMIVDVRDEVKILSNKPSDNWMLGVKGLKLTLQNQSSVTITDALIEVQYFGEDETLLDKKMLQFKDIKPNKKATVAVPDHRLANHTSHKIVSANGVTQQ